MKKAPAALSLLFALSMVLLASAPGYCYREKPGVLVNDNQSTAGAKKILITYDSEHGATSRVAKIIFDTLSDNASVDLKFVENLDPAEIENYDGIIIGTPIYTGKWLPGIKRLLKYHHADIAKIPSAFFITCTYVRQELDTPERQAHAIELYFDPTLSKYADIQPVDKGVLAGEFQYKDLYPFERLMMQYVTKFPEGKFIDEVKVRDWAQGVWDKMK